MTFLGSAPYPRLACVSGSGPALSPEMSVFRIRAQ